MSALGIAYGHVGAGRPRSLEETRERTRAALNAWLHGDYIAPDTPAARYFAARGFPWLAAKRFRTVLRWRPDARHPDGLLLPAILCAVTDAVGNFRALHRIFLKREQPEKFGAPMSLGPIAGHAIRLGEPCDGELIVAEGLETTAAAGALLRLPGWSAIACGNLGHSLVLPPEVTRVTIAVDRDREGEHAAEAAARRWRAEGRSVRFLVPDQAGTDANDVLRSGGLQHA